MPRHDGRAPGELRPVTIERGFVRNSPGSVLYRAGGDDRPGHGPPLRQGPAVPRGEGGRLADRRVRDAPRQHPDPQVARGRRPVDRDPAADRPEPPGGRSTPRRSAPGRSTSTPTCSRPTAGPGPPRSRPPSSPWPTPCASRFGTAARRDSPRQRRRRQRRDRRGRAGPRPRLPRGLDGRGRLQRRPARRAADSSRSRGRARGGPSRGPSSTRFSTSPRAGSTA